MTTVTLGGRIGTLFEYQVTGRLTDTETSTVKQIFFKNRIILWLDLIVYNVYRRTYLEKYKLR